MEKLKCACCGKEIEIGKEFEIEFKFLGETENFCKECFADVYAYATGYNLDNFWGENDE